MADRQEAEETKTTQRIREAPPTHRPTQPSHTQPQHNQRHTPRLTHPQEATQTHTERQRRPMPRPSLPLPSELQPHHQERTQPNHQAQTEHNDKEAGKPSMARHDDTMV